MQSSETASNPPIRPSLSILFCTALGPTNLHTIQRCPHIHVVHAILSQPCFFSLLSFRVSYLFLVISISRCSSWFLSCSVSRPSFFLQFCSFLFYVIILTLLACLAPLFLPPLSHVCFPLFFAHLSPHVPLSLHRRGADLNHRCQIQRSTGVSRLAWRGVKCVVSDLYVTAKQPPDRPE